MSIASSDLIAYGSLNRPEDDSSTSGGGIDVDNRPVFTQMASTTTLRMRSSAAGDTTQTVTITGRNAAGAIISDTQTVNGTSNVNFSGSFERVLKVLMNADAVGIITIETTGAVAIGTIPIGERGFYAMFLKSASDTGSTVRYEKIFWLNNHGSLTLNSAAMKLTADPSSKMKIGCETSLNGTQSVSNRVSVPSGPTFVDDNVSQSVPTGAMAAADKVGVWIEMTLAGGAAAVKDTFTTELSGTSV